MASEHTVRVGRRIRERRETLGMKQRELADLIPGNADSNQVSKWERGIHRPSDDTLGHIADALDTTIAYFMTDAPAAGTPDLMSTLGRGTDAARLDQIESTLADLADAVRALQKTVTANGTTARATGRKISQLLEAVDQPDAELPEDRREAQ